MNETTRAALDLILSGIYTGQVILDSDELIATGDDDLHLIEREIRKQGGRTAVDEDGDLRIVDYAPPAHTISGKLWAAAKEWTRQGGRWAVTVREVEDIAHEHAVSYASVQASAGMLAIPVLA